MNPNEAQAKQSAYRLQDKALEQALLSGSHAEALEQYLGEAAYEELRQLALDAHKLDVRGGQRVLILPGIMGSRLGHPGKLFDDTLWVDPLEIALGHLDELALGKKADKIEALGVILLAYLKLKLYLKIKGYDADFHPFDWRQDIGVLGKQLAGRLKREGRRKISLVAHSMGGLVARGALAQGGGASVERLIMLGTPNHGSFVPVQAFRGVYPIVRKIAALDQHHSARDLAAKVFNTFPGLYQMLPWPDKFSEIDLYDLKNWPTDRPRPLAKLLKRAPATQQSLAPADQRYFLIAGVNQETITDLRSVDNGFIYEQTFNGDGTVPLDLALLAGARTYYIEEAHGSLPNNGKVEAAVTDILATGHTEVLPDHWSPSRQGVVRQLKDEALREPAFDGRTGSAVRPSEIRSLLAEVAAPAKREAAAAETFSGPPTSIGSGYAHKFARVVVGRRRQYRIDIRLALGSITEVDAAAYVLGMFQDVEPTGPAKVLNARLGGVITDFTSRRMITGNLGNVFLMPIGRYSLPADMILIAGLGYFDRFGDDAMQLCAENTIRTFVRSKIDEFATVLFGAGSGLGIQRSLTNLVTGFFRGLLDADVDRRFRRITICEYDPVRFEEIKRELYRLASTSLFDEVEATIDEMILPAPIVSAPDTRRHPEGPDPVYLIVRREGEARQGEGYRSSILTSGEKATVITGIREVTQRNLDAQLNKIKGNQFTFNRMNAFGTQLAELVLPPEILAVLPRMKNRPMVVVHDAPSSRVPWETIRIADWSPAIAGGLSRRYAADNLSVAKWLEERRHGRSLDLLLVVNPTEDLDGAEKEGTRIHQLFDAHALVNITELRGPEASKPQLKRAFQSGRYDVVHYAGHAYFNEQAPSRSGILCHGQEVLSGAELAGFGNLPSLVFFNACEAARVRGAARSPLNVRARINANVGLAEAFLRGGVANYVGTYWPVGDAAAKTFAEVFYPALLTGESISSALLTARQSVEAIRSRDWADYVHYGSPNFVIKFAD